MKQTKADATGGRKDLEEAQEARLKDQLARNHKGGLEVKQSKH